MIFLTTDDLWDLTDRKQAAAQIRWLAARNWVYAVGGDGLPKVARVHFDQRMLGESADEMSADGLTTKTTEWHVNTGAMKTKN